MLNETTEDMEAAVVSELAPQEAGWFFDVGAGHGRLLPLYAREDRRIVLVDYAMNLLQTAKKSNDRDNIHCVVADAYHLPFRSETFRGGLSIRTFHHMEDPGAFLAELSRVTRAGAEILVEYSNKRNLPRLLRRGAAAFRKDHECYSGVLFGTHPAYFDGLCREAGLRVVMNRGLGSFERLWKSGRLFLLSPLRSTLRSSSIDKALHPMNTDQVLAHIDPEAIARDTLAFVEVKSETCTEGPGSDFLAALLKREGFEVEMDPVEPGRPNVYTRIAGAGGGPALAFNGHTDTIPIGISTPPGRDGDWIIGRGTEDMKGGLVAMVHAASALKKAGVRLAGDLWLTGVIGHEAPEGKKEGPKRLIEHLRSGKVPANAIIIVEGPCAIWAASLGSTIFNIEIKDDRGPIHTIKIPYETNPAHWVGKLLVEFQEREEEFKKQPAHPLCGRQLYNVGIVQGGDYMNRLPAEFKISGTRRWTPGTTLTDIRAEFQEICDRYSQQSSMRWSYTLEGDREPFETPAGHQIVQALLDSGEAVSGQRPAIIGMGLVGDANLYANDGGVKTVYYGPAHQTAHSDHERVSIAQLTHCAKVYALAAMQYCGVKG